MNGILFQTSLIAFLPCFHLLSFDIYFAYFALEIGMEFPLLQHISSEDAKDNYFLSPQRGLYPCVSKYSCRESSVLSRRKCDTCETHVRRKRNDSEWSTRAISTDEVKSSRIWCTLMYHSPFVLSATRWMVKWRDIRTEVDSLSIGLIISISISKKP